MALSDKELDMLTEEAKLKTTELIEKKQLSKERLEMIQDSNVFQIMYPIDREGGDRGRLTRFNKKIIESGVLMHYVTDKNEGMRCAGITFPDGTYVHLDLDVEQSAVLSAADCSEEIKSL